MVADKNVARNASLKWCREMNPHKESPNFFVLVCGNIYGFNVANDERTLSWEALHPRPITFVVYLPDLLAIFTNSQNTDLFSTILLRKTRAGL